MATFSIDLGRRTGNFSNGISAGPTCSLVEMWKAKNSFHIPTDSAAADQCLLRLMRERENGYDSGQTMGVVCELMNGEHPRGDAPPLPAPLYPTFPGS